MAVHDSRGNLVPRGRADTGGPPSARSAADAPPVAGAAPNGRVMASDGLMLHVRRRGVGEPVILVFPDAVLWDAFDGYEGPGTLIGYDPRGRGRSDPLARATAVGLEADVGDFERIAERLALGKLRCVAWGYYGTVAAEFAGRHPGWVERLLVIAPLPLVAQPDMGLAAERMARWKGSGRCHVNGGGEPARAEIHGASILFQDLHVHPTRLGAPDCALQGNESPARLRSTLARTHAALGDWNWRRTAARLTTPTVIVHGDHDPVEIDSVREWSLVAPDARLVVLEGTSRYPWIERPRHFRYIAAHALGL